MKKVLLALTSAAVLVWAGLAVADYNVIDQGSYYKNAQTGAKTDATGNAYVNEASKDRDFALLRTVMTTSLTGRTVAGALPTAPSVIQDSTEAIDVRGYNGMALMLYPTFESTVSSVTVALQIRWHYSAQVDSVSTFIEQGARAFPVASANATGRDTLGSFVYAPATATGPSRYSASFTGGDSLATPDEQVVVFTNVSGVNRGRLVRIFSPNSSAGACGPYMSVRVRFLNSYNGSGIALGSDATTRLSAYLVGWR